MDLKLSGLSAQPKLLDNAEVMRSFLAGLAKEIGMTIINGPTVVSFKEFSGDPAAGLSGVVIIAESHIACHTWPDQSYVQVSIDSCRVFDANLAEAYFKDRLWIEGVLDRRLDERNWAPR